VSEAETNITWLTLCAAVVARDWEPLRDAVLRVISRGGGKTAPGLSRINRCLRSGLLELMREAPDGTITVYSKADCEHLTVCAPLVHPAEGIRVEPYQEGDWFIRRASPAEPTSPVEPVALDSLPTDIEPATALEPELATRRQRDRTIEAIKTLYPPNGIRPKDVSIAMLTNRINKLPEFKENRVSEDTVGRALQDIKVALEK
jgi:hypothetical protein